MDPYTFSLVLGVAGLGVMALGGLGHHGSHAGHHLHGQEGAGAHNGHGALTPSHGPGHATTHGAEHGAHHDSGQASARLWVLLSPRVLFSVAVGLGASGVLLARWLSEPWLAVGALLGGVGFEVGMVRPIWNRLLRFASNPARTLESAVFDVAEAVTDFDAEGQGLVALELDGQVTQILARLRPDEVTMGVRVRRGARVRIEAVDARRNRCLVSALGA